MLINGKCCRLYYVEFSFQFDCIALEFYLFYIRIVTRENCCNFYIKIMNEELFIMYLIYRCESRIQSR